MTVVRPETLEQLVEARADLPDALLVAGATDVMVAVNEGRSRPEHVIDLRRVSDLQQYEVGDETVRIGAGVSFSRIERQVAGVLPALATAARTVGSPQIRNRGTLGGNVGTASPAGDALPVVVAMDGIVELASARGSRQVPAREYFIGPGRTVLCDDECIVAVVLPRLRRGGQSFSKVGPRNAMVISVASVCVHVDLERRIVGVGVGSAAPTPVPAPDAEALLQDALASVDWLPQSLPLEVFDDFGHAVSAATSPIDDLRGSARYRRHVIQVLARRCLSQALAQPEDVR